MDNIELIKEKHYSCFQIAIATYLRNNEFPEYWLAFPNCWQFDYSLQDDKKNIGDRLNSLWLSDIEEIKCYTGISLRETQNIISGCYLIEIDAYDCFWSTVYKKHHIPHYFILIIDDDGNSSMVVDSFFGKKIKVEKRDANLGNFKRCFEIAIGTGHTIELKRVVNMAYSNMNRVDGGFSGFQKMRSFARDLLCYQSERKNEDSSEKIFMNPIYKNFLILEGGRYNFLRIISEDLKMRSDVLCYDLFHLKTRWEEVRMNFCRFLLTGKSGILERISESIIMISHSEEDILNRLYELYNTNN